MADAASKGKDVQEESVVEKNKGDRKEGRSDSQSELSFWSLIELLSPLSPMASSMAERTEDKKKNKKKIPYGFRESLVPEDYVPPPKKHPIVFEGSMIGKEVGALTVSCLSHSC